MAPLVGAVGVSSVCPLSGARGAGCSAGASLLSPVGAHLRFVLRLVVVDAMRVGGSVVGLSRPAFFCHWHGGLKCRRD